jgi:hypothetical protein
MVVKILCAVFAVVALAVAAPASASIITFNTESAYLAAIGAPGVDTFDDLSVESISSPLNRTAGAYNYTTSAPGDFFPAASGTDVWLATTVPTDPIAFTNFSAGVVGVGGFFFGSDILGAFLPDQTITVSATDADGTMSLDLVNPTTTTFLGFVTDNAFTSVTVLAVQPGNDTPAWPTVNNLTVGVAPTTGPTPVPEPVSLLLLATGLVAARAKRQTKAPRA